jgi:glycerol kinase
MVILGFEIGDSEALLQAVRHLRFRRLCIKIIIKGIQKSEITDCDTGGCGMWDTKGVSSVLILMKFPHF